MRIAWPWSPSALEHGGFIAIGLLVYVLATRVGKQRRHPSAAIGWVLSIIAFPYVAVPLFLIFGTRKVARAPAVGVAEAPVDTAAREHVPRWAAVALAAMHVEPPCRVGRVEFQSDGAQALRSLIELCDGAASTLAVQTFVFRNDAVGQAAARALGAAARRGVRTRLLVDGVGSAALPRGVVHQLRSAGVEVRSFMPLLHNPMRGRTNLRNHRKLAVADGSVLWAGGRNLAIEYFVDSGGRRAWIDLGFTATGSLAASAQRQFDDDWLFAGGSSTSAGSDCRLEHVADSGGSWAQWVASGPDRRDDTLHDLLMTAAYHANQRILAVTPYFVPDDALLQALLMAARRGVKVSLVLPARSNHRLADIAREKSVRALVDAGADVRLTPCMVHAKVLVIDEGVAMCGSLNLDGRSLFLNYEAMAVFYGRDEVQWLAEWTRSLAATGQPHPGGAPSLARDVLEGVVRAIGFQL